MLKSEAPQRNLQQRRRLERLLAGQKRVLEMIVGDEPLEDILNAITSLIEVQDSSLICTIMVVTEDGGKLRCLAPGSLPDEFVQAIPLVPIGPGKGSCGTAAHLKQAVVVRDIATDPKCAGHAELALRSQLRACWSTPILDSTGQLLGTFAIYHGEPCEPTEDHLELIELATHLAGICLQRTRGTRRIRRTLGQVLRGLADVESDPKLPPDARARLTASRTQISSLLGD